MAGAIASCYLRPGMLKTAIYLRVSTEEHTTDNQKPELVRLARMRGFRVLKRHVYSETGSAAKARPVFDEMMEAARRGEFSALIIWAIDRFGRSMVENLRAIFALDALKVKIISSRESWLEVEGPARELLIAILSWVAEQERVRLSERTRAGMARARAQGKHVGRPLAHVNVTLARALMDGGASQAAIAKQLGVSAASVSRALKRASVAKGASPRQAAN